MSEKVEGKRGRGKPLGYRKPDGRRVLIRIRWTDAETEIVKAAAQAAGEDFSTFVRTAALERARLSHLDLEQDNASTPI